MYLLSFSFWSSASGMFFIRERVYAKWGWGSRFGWTPFVKLRKRYPTWLGYFKKESIRN